jgi:hypothetical protein
LILRHLLVVGSALLWWTRCRGSGMMSDTVAPVVIFTHVPEWLLI